MTTRYRTARLRIAILVGVCLSLSGYSGNFAYRSKPQRLPPIRPEADAWPDFTTDIRSAIAAPQQSQATSIHLHGPAATLASAESFLRPPVANGQLLAAAHQTLPVVLSSDI